MRGPDVTERRPPRVLFDGAATVPRLDHPEGVAVHPVDGSLWCGGEAGQVYRIDPEAGTIEQVATSGGFCLGVAFDHAGGLLVCDSVRAAVLRLAPGASELDVISEGADGAPLRLPNACAVDAAGAVYVTDSRAQGDPGPGVFRIDPHGATELWCDAPIHFANGVALTADGSALLVVESWERRLLSIPIRGDGTAGSPEVVAELAGTVPDGVAVAADGSIWVSCYEPSQIVRIDPAGGVAVVAADPDAHVLCHPTNIAFRGEQLVAANLGRWHLSVLDAGVGGVALPLGRAA